MRVTFDLPVTHEAEIVVCGGGPAGVAAALSAARNGAKTLLIERMGFCGGSATAMQVPAFAPFSDRTKAITRGIGWEILTEHARRLGRPVPDPDIYAVPQDLGRMDWAPIDVETLKRIYDDLLEAAGVTVLYHTFVPQTLPAFPSHPSPNPFPRSFSRFAGTREGELSRPPFALFPRSEGRREGRGGMPIDALVLANKSGLSLARGKVYIDATGDADLAALAGCPFELGDDEGQTQGATLCFTLAGGSRTAYLEYVNRTGDGYLKNLVAQAREGGDFPLPDASLVGLSFKDESVAGCNLGHVYGIDATNSQSVSSGEREGRRVAAILIEFIRRYVPGQEGARLVSTGPHLGIRESRRIVGDYRLTLDDYLSCRSFPDEIARSAYFIDLHAATTEAAARAKSVSDGQKTSASLPPGESHGIPYRCLLPQDVQNLLVAGRSLSAERAVQGAARIMPVCFSMGQAAGLAAQIALALSGDVRAVNTDALRAKLRAQGAWLP